ncbi:MAG: hypothetical protein JO317_08500 [Verrucomicrobiae bacterium]|nr:hypothetical protein [Verrucomicrobiae bacterium]
MVHRNTLRKALLWVVGGLALTALALWRGVDLLGETNAYLSTQRTPVMVPGGAGKF